MDSGSGIGDFVEQAEQLAAFRCRQGVRSVARLLAGKQAVDGNVEAARQAQQFVWREGTGTAGLAFAHPLFGRFQVGRQGGTGQAFLAAQA
ncbi:MAG: hypothetical protein H7841_09960, partial [Magnetospirillum sp. WYHS-4]